MGFTLAPACNQKQTERTGEDLLDRKQGALLW